MDTPFSQPKITYKVSFNTLYKYLEAFEKFFPEDILGISTFEVDSKTIEAADDDIWYIEAYFFKTVLFNCAVDPHTVTFIEHAI